MNLNINEAATHLGVSASYLRKKVAVGAIPHYRFGRKLVFDTALLDRWKAAHLVGEPPASGGPMVAWRRGVDGR